MLALFWLMAAAADEPVVFPVPAGAKLKSQRVKALSQDADTLLSQSCPESGHCSHSACREPCVVQLSVFAPRNQLEPLGTNCRGCAPDLPDEGLCAADLPDTP